MKYIYSHATLDTPPADHMPIDVPLYKPDVDVTLHRTTPGTTPPIPPAGEYVWSYQSLVLDLSDDSLRFVCEDWRQPYDETQNSRAMWDAVPWISANPWKETIGGQRYRTGTKIVWTIRSGNNWTPWLTDEQGDALAARALPYAQTIVENLWECGTTWDWSATSAIAAQTIEDLCQMDVPNHHLTHDTAVYDARDLLTKTALSSSLFERPVSEMTDEDLMFYSFPFAGVLGEQTPEARDDRGWRNHQDAMVVGTRALLLAIRNSLTHGRTPIPAETWIADHPEVIADLVAGSSDEDISALAQQAQTRAEFERVQITGLAPHLHSLRTQQRAAIRHQLTLTGGATKDAEDRLKRLRTQRTALLLSVISWGEGDTETELAREACMSRQAVRQLKDRYDSEGNDL